MPTTAAAIWIRIAPTAMHANGNKENKQKINTKYVRELVMVNVIMACGAFQMLKIYVC